MTVDTSASLIDEALSRSIAEILPSREELEEQMRAGRKLHFYMGIDPTAEYVHLGHSTNYLVLERLHKLGHKITVLVGDFTAMIGDPSDKGSERVQLTREQVERNLQTFRSQIQMILDLHDVENPIDFRFNSEWLARLDFRDAVELASNFTVQQMLERETFRKRVDEGKPLHVHELMYPLMQGYDSVALEVDAEVGGMDQKFNMLAGRTLLRRYKAKNKFVLMTTLLVNPKTGEKLMSKSLGTGVALTDPPNDMFFKIMRLPDEGMLQCFIDCTRLPMAEVTRISHQLDTGHNPRDVKLQLAETIVTMYHGAAQAGSARTAWLDQVSQKQLPTELSELAVMVTDGKVDLVQALIDCGSCTTKGQARRLLAGGGVRLNGAKVMSESVQAKDGDVLKAGKRFQVRLSLTQ